MCRKALQKIRYLAAALRRPARSPRGYWSRRSRRPATPRAQALQRHRQWSHRATFHAQTSGRSPAMMPKGRASKSATCNRSRRAARRAHETSVRARTRRSLLGSTPYGHRPRRRLSVPSLAAFRCPHRRAPRRRQPTPRRRQPMPRRLATPPPPPTLWTRPPLQTIPPWILKRVWLPPILLQTCLPLIHGGGGGGCGGGGGDGARGILIGLRAIRGGCIGVRNGGMHGLRRRRYG